ncbi:universal stress protein [Dyella soli]|uniref:Universal stress protein UspA n=1 Tax=Dyella soli TaxID=522319 RepID=A0A4R0YUL2_9GAMM|nr:universal stress protein [Dyella soli]TCI10202.1 universal stress protein UspA [Dyella soli]
MYRHLLVPLDDTELSIETVSRAVKFAHSMGARVSFLHVQADHAASLTGEADAVRLTSPAEYRDTYQDRARALLTKAESAARALGVPCDALVRVGATPYEAILEVAHGAGCDLIFMASHGRRSSVGMMLGSQTLKVLTHGELPVLVSSARESANANPVVAAIREEHRSLAAVLHAWLHLVNTYAQQGGTADVPLMRSMVRYIMEFPAAVRRVKGHGQLYRRLRERTAVFHAELDELERQQERGRSLVEAHAALLDRYDRGAATLAELRDAVEQYARFMWEQMGREEGVIVPAAERYLTEADWSAIHAAFAGTRGSEDDAEAEYRQLFSRIVNSTPA